MKPPAIMTNEMRLQAILDRKSSEGVLLQNVMELDSLSEDADFWISIVSDRSYSASHRRIATVQYFVRHMFYRKAWEINLSAMKLQPSECRPEVMRMVAGVVLVSHELDEVLLRVYFIFSEIDWLCVYLSLFPNAEDSLLLHAISGTKKNCSFVIMDVAVGEHLHSGASILWQRWQRRQVYTCQDTGRPPVVWRDPPY